jgi:hypothetical protein
MSSGWPSIHGICGWMVPAWEVLANGQIDLSDGLLELTVNKT